MTISSAFAGLTPAIDGIQAPAGTETGAHERPWSGLCRSEPNPVVHAIEPASHGRPMGTIDQGLPVQWAPRSDVTNVNRPSVSVEIHAWPPIVGCVETY